MKYIHGPLKRLDVCAPKDWVHCIRSTARAEPTRPAEEETEDGEGNGNAVQPLPSPNARLDAKRLGMQLRRPD